MITAWIYGVLAAITWQHRRNMALLDAAMETQRVALGSALVPPLLKWVSSIEPIMSELVQLKSSRPAPKKRNRNA